MSFEIIFIGAQFSCRAGICWLQNKEGCVDQTWNLDTKIGNIFVSIVLNL